MNPSLGSTSIIMCIGNPSLGHTSINFHSQHMPPFMLLLDLDEFLHGFGSMHTHLIINVFRVPISMPKPFFIMSGPYVDQGARVWCHVMWAPHHLSWILTTLGSLIGSFFLHTYLFIFGQVSSPSSPKFCLSMEGWLRCLLTNIVTIIDRVGQ